MVVNAAFALLLWQEGGLRRGDTDAWMNRLAAMTQ
jgi:hypothetical protein